MDTKPNFLHDQKSNYILNLRHSIFGIEDGMVSTLGALTGIAVGANNAATVILAGLVIIAVESVSMGVGTYLSSKTVSEVDQLKLNEEESQIKNDLGEETKELKAMYLKDGWSEELSLKMAKEASENKKLMLTEMSYRELGIIPKNLEFPLSGAIFMYFFYIFGGLIPLLPYIFLDLSIAIYFSIAFTLAGLFIVGAVITKFTRKIWWKNGLRILTLASFALLFGFLIGWIFQVSS